MSDTPRSPAPGFCSRERRGRLVRQVSGDGHRRSRRNTHDCCLDLADPIPQVDSFALMRATSVFWNVPGRIAARGGPSSTRFRLLPSMFFRPTAHSLLVSCIRFHMGSFPGLAHLSVTVGRYPGRYSTVRTAHATGHPVPCL